MSPRFKFDMYDCREEQQRQIDSRRNWRRSIHDSRRTSFESQNRMGVKKTSIALRHFFRDEPMTDDFCNTTRSWRWSCAPTEHHYGSKNSMWKNPKRRRDHIWRYLGLITEREHSLRESHKTSDVVSFRTFAFARRDWRWVTSLRFTSDWPIWMSSRPLVVHFVFGFSRRRIRSEIFSWLDDSFIPRWRPQEKKSDRCTARKEERVRTTSQGVDTSGSKKWDDQCNDDTRRGRHEEKRKTDVETTHTKSA